MHIDGYVLQAKSDFLTFEFNDEGKVGAFHMGIQYSPLPSYANIYNLAFGVVKEVEESGELDLDDKVETKNGTFVYVIATVAKSLFVFWERYPNMSVYVAGSDRRRTSLYHKTLVQYGYQLGEDVIIYGLKETGLEPMKSYLDESYSAFIIEPLNQRLYGESQF